MYVLCILLLIVVVYMLNQENSIGFENSLPSKYIVTYPRDSLDIFADATFKPSCCPTPYSTSSGCLCPSPNDAGLIIIRGGNRKR